MKIQSYKDLIVWQKAMGLARAVYVLTDQFPREEIYGMTAQIKRAAISIPSNIAEGSRRGTKLDFSPAEGLLGEVMRMLNTMTRDRLI
jgi:four helix bundle protein